MFTICCMYGALTPGALNGDKPKSYGTDRRCACGAKIMQYRKGDRCGLCEDNDEVHARRVREREEAMLGRKLWKSKEYPDGCIECPEDEKFDRRHASGGRCSKHYQRFKKNAERAARAGAADEQRARDLGGHENGTVASLPPLDDPRLDGRLEEGAAQTIAHPTAEELAAGRDDISILDDEGDDADPSLLPGIDPDVVAGKHLPSKPEGCPRDADETCCFDPDDCNPGWRDESEPEEGEAIVGVAIVDKGIRGTLLRSRDPEIEAMYAVSEALEPLDRAARLRVMTWAASRFGLDRAPEPEPSPFD